MDNRNDDRNQEIKITVATKSESKITLTRKMFVVLVCLFVALSIIIAAFTGALVHNNAMKVQNVNLNSVRAVDSPVKYGENDIVSVVNAVADTVVEVQAKITKYNIFNQPIDTYSAGSGVIISDNGAIITNNHVIAGATTIQVILKDGTIYPAQTVGGVAKDDIAVLKINATDLPYAVFGNSDALSVGETVVAIGNPLGTLGGTVTNGIISALNRDINVDGTVMNLLQTNAEINSGNSGGGLFNLRGELIGIVSAKSAVPNAEGIGFAIPSNHALKVATQIMGG